MGNLDSNTGDRKIYGDEDLGYSVSTGSMSPWQAKSCLNRIRLDGPPLSYIPEERLTALRERAEEDANSPS